MDTQYKATLSESNRKYNKLTLTVIDSFSASGETVFEVPISGNQVELDAKVDQWCLGHRKCFFLIL